MGERTMSGRRAGTRSKWLSPVWLAALAVGVIAVIALASALAWVFVRQGDGSNAAASAPPAQPPSPLVGKPAPSFTLLSESGRPYTFTPGDGKKHVFVFFMGYF